MNEQSINKIFIMNGTYEKKKSQIKRQGSKLKYISKAKRIDQVQQIGLDKILGIVVEKAQNAIQDLFRGIDKINVETKTTKGKIKVNVNLANTAESHPSQLNSEIDKNLPAVKSTKQKLAELEQFRKKAAQRHSKHKSLRKSLQKQGDQQQKKFQRIKQIGKRKIQLMDRLKKLDAELSQAKKQQSPSSHSRMDSMLLQSKINKSYIRNFNNSRLNRLQQNSSSVVQQHSKNVSILQRINNQKLKKQQKIAQQFRRKQQQQIKKLQEMQRSKYLQLQRKQKMQYENIGQSLYRSKYKKTNKTDKMQTNSSKGSYLNLNENTKKIKINSAMDTHLYQNQFQEQIQHNSAQKQNDLMPMTMTNYRNNAELQQINQDKFFNDQGALQSGKHLLTQRNQTDQLYQSMKINEKPVQTTQNMIKASIQQQVQRIQKDAIQNAQDLLKQDLQGN